jgi:hypothetical protein
MGTPIKDLKKKMATYSMGSTIGFRRRNPPNEIIAHENGAK